MTEYTDLYTPRQMLLMTTLCDLVDAEIAEATNDALQAGMADDGIPLQDGGTGALAYGQAVGVYLSLAISGHADFQSSLCSWDNRHGNIRAAFMMQALPMTWVFGETNPFASATGNISSQIRNAAEVLSHMDPVAGTEQFLGFPGKWQGDQCLDDKGSRRPHGRSQEIRQSSADGCRQECIRLGQEGSCHVDQGIPEMEIAPVGAHGDMADISRKEADQTCEQACQDQ